MSCTNKIYKGEDSVLHFYIEDNYTNLSIKVYTDGKTMVTPSEITTEAGLITMYFHNDDLDILNDGVLRYDVQYDVDGETVVRSICSDRYLKTPDGYSAMTAEEVYNQGYAAGFEAGESGDCTSAITIAFQSGYTDGHLAGMVEQAIADANRLTHLSATTNGTYTAPYGYSEVIVDVPASSGSSSGDCSEAIAEAYESGWTGGIFEQKGKLVSSAFTANGIYTREDGFNSIEINVTEDLTWVSKAMGFTEPDKYVHMYREPICNNGIYILDFYIHNPSYFYNYCYLIDKVGDDEGYPNLAFRFSQTSFQFITRSGYLDVPMTVINDTMYHAVVNMNSATHVTTLTLSYNDITEFTSGNTWTEDLGYFIFGGVYDWEDGGPHICSGIYITSLITIDNSTNTMIHNYHWKDGGMVDLVDGRVFKAYQGYWDHRDWYEHESTIDGYLPLTHK